MYSTCFQQHRTQRYVSVIVRNLNGLQGLIRDCTIDHIRTGVYAALIVDLLHRTGMHAARVNHGPCRHYSDYDRTLDIATAIRETYLLPQQCERDVPGKPVGSVPDE
jgi:hypothetical protein